jgi:hypothetical protein
MPPSVHSSAPDHARHAHEDLLRGGGDSHEPKVINKRPTTTSSAGVTTAGATAPTTTGDESRRPSSSRAPQSVSPPSLTGMGGPAAVRRRKVGSGKGPERELVRRKKRTVPGACTNTDTGRPSAESETETTTNATTTRIQGPADNASGSAVVSTNQMSTMGMYGSPYSLGMSPYGGLGMYGGMGMYGGGMMMGGAGPFSGLNNFLFGFQSVVFSLGQAMQVRFCGSFVVYLSFSDQRNSLTLHAIHFIPCDLFSRLIDLTRKDTGNEHPCSAAAFPHGHVLFRQCNINAE